MRVALGFPVYSGFAFESGLALMDLASLLTARSILYDRIVHVRDPDVSRARNAVLASFLRSGSERLLFVDHDVNFRGADALRLLRSSADYVGANYPQKRLGGGWASTPKEGGRREGTLVEAEMLATGLLSLSRRAVERLSDASTPYLTDDGLLATEIARAGVLGGRWASEDEAMCRRWQELGEIAWIDESVRCTHIGTHEFTRETAS